MSVTKSSLDRSNSSLIGKTLWIIGCIFVLALIILLTMLMQRTGSLAGFFQWLFAIDSVQLMWYITRSAGLTAYLVLWLSVAWGLAVSSKILDNLLHRSFTYDFHQFLSLLAIGFIALHLGALLFDRYLPYTPGQILIPFLSPYRSLWVAVGVIAFYLTLLVTVTFYLRSRIGMKAFRAIHVLSLVAYLGVALHGIMAGTDTALTSVALMYVSTFLSVVFLMSYWLIFLVVKKRLPARTAVRAQRQKTG